LWEKDPTCHWCNIETIWVFKNGGRLPWNAATIDHYFSRYQIDERKKWGSPVVLSCSQCNQRRGSAETRLQPIEELQRRGKQHETNEV